MGLSDDAKKFAAQQAQREAAEAKKKADAERQLKQVHPWNITVDKAARKLLGEFTQATSRILPPTVCMVFRGSPRPSYRGDQRYSKGERTGLKGWCLFGWVAHESRAEAGLGGYLFAVTTQNTLVRTSGLAKRGTYTYTGFLGPSEVICLPPDHYNPYHGKVLKPNTLIKGAHALQHDWKGFGPQEHLPSSTYTDLSLREVLSRNLACVLTGTHPQQTDSWQR